jgi:hypothetical protein
MLRQKFSELPGKHRFIGLLVVFSRNGGALITSAFAICLPLLFLMITPALTVAQTPNEKPQIKSFKTRAIMDGIFREGGWSAIEVDITNGPQPLEAELRTNFPVLVNNTITSEYSHVTPVNLAPDQQERYVHYIQLSARNTQVTLSLVDKQGNQLAQNNQRLQQLGATDFVVGWLMDSPPASDQPPRIGFTTIRNNSTGIRLFYLKTDDLKDRKELLDPVNALLIGDIGPTSLTAEKKRALLAWVSNGGQLFVFGGPKQQAQLAALGIDPALLPATTTSNVTLNKIAFRGSLIENFEVPGSYSVEASRLLPNPGSFIGLRQAPNAPEAELPLLVAKPLGQGAIVMTAVDLLSAPFVSWNRVNFIWSNILISADPNFNLSRSSQNFFNQENIGRAMVNSPGQSLPEPEVLLGFMLGFMALTVPLSYVVLRRFKRLELIWVVAPVLVMVFTGFTLFIASLAAVGDIHLNRVSLIESTNDELPASVKSYMVISAATDNPYRLELDGDLKLLRAQPIQLSTQISFLPPPLLVQGNGAAAVTTLEASNRLQSFAAEGMADVRLGLETKLNYGLEGINGTITNRGGYKIKDAVLIYGDNYLFLGNIHPGEDKKVTFTLERNPTLLPRPNIDPNIYVPESVVKDNPSDRPRQPGTGNPWFTAGSPEGSQAFVRWSTLNATYQAGRFIPDEKTNNLYFTGWLDDHRVLGDARVEGQKLVQQEQALVVRPIPLSYKTAETQVNIPPQALLAERTQDSSNSGSNLSIINQNMTIVQFQMPNGFTLPRFQATTLSLYLNSFKEKDRAAVIPASQQFSTWREPVPSGQYQYMPRIELFNWSKNSWEEVQAAGFTELRLDLNQPEINEYIDRNVGYIRVRLTGGGETIILQQINLGVQGQIFS